MKFEENCLYVPLGPKDSDDEKGPNIRKDWDGPTIKNPGTYSSEGNLWTYEERQEEDWDRWGVAGWNGDKRLLILDFDIYKMEDKRKKKVIETFNEKAPKTRVHKSQSNGFHLFYLVDLKNLEAEFTNSGNVRAKLPVKLDKYIDDKLNGYVVDPQCEGYEVHIDKEICEINPKTDLPVEWLSKDDDSSTVEESEELDDDELEEILEKALDEDEKFKHLYKGEYEKAGFGDRSSAEASLSSKIGYWFGRNEENIRRVMNSSKAEKWHERDDSSYRDSIVKVGLQGEDEYNHDCDLDDELLDEIQKRINDKDKLTWDCETEFVTFTSDIELEEKKIEWGDTYELPKEISEKLVEDKKATYGIWKCSDCGRNHYQEEEPIMCANDDGDEHKANYDFIPLHPSTPEEMGDVLLKNYRFATPSESITEDKPGKVHIYEDGIYHNPGTMASIRGKVKQIDRNSRQADQKHVINHITTLEYEPEDKFGLDEHKVVIENGILDLKTMEKEPHDPDKLALAKLPCDYDPEAECPKFKQFLKETIPSERDRDLIQELLGTALINDKIHKRAIMIPGPTDAGKSTLCNIIRGVFGKDSVGGHTPKAIADSDWARAKLRDILLNISDETSSGKIYRTERLKKALDGNPMEADEKYSAVFEFEPTCEHIYGTNMTPTVTRSDQAFWNRWIVTPTRDEPVPEDEQNPDLVDEILDEEVEGIFNWIIQGYERYMDKDKGFSRGIDWTEERDKWLQFGDSIQRFIQNCLHYEEGNKIKANDLHDIYRQYVTGSDTLELDSQRNLTKQVKKLSYVAYSQKYRFEGKQAAGFKHLGVDLEEIGNVGGGIDQTQRCERKEGGAEASEQGLGNTTPKLPTKQKETLRDILDCGKQAPDIAESVDMDQEQVEEALDDLFDKGLVEKTGSALGGGTLFKATVEGRNLIERGGS